MLVKLPSGTADVAVPLRHQSGKAADADNAETEWRSHVRSETSTLKQHGADDNGISGKQVEA